MACWCFATTMSPITLRLLRIHITSMCELALQRAMTSLQQHRRHWPMCCARSMDTSTRRKMNKGRPTAGAISTWGWLPRNRTGRPLCEQRAGAAACAGPAAGTEPCAASIQCASAQLAVTDAGFQPAGRRSRGCVAMQRGFGNVRRAGRRRHVIIGHVLFSGDAVITGAKTAGVGTIGGDDDTGFGCRGRQRNR